METTGQRGLLDFRLIAIQRLIRLGRSMIGRERYNESKVEIFSLQIECRKIRDWVAKVDLGLISMVV